MFRIACALLLLAPCGLRAAPTGLPWKIPPLDGELAGEFTVRATPEAPVLTWKISARTARPRERMIDLAIDGPGLRVRLAAVLDPAGEGTWELREAEVDVGRWLPSIAALWPDFPLGPLVIGGHVKAQGAGGVSGGVPRGRLQLTLRDGRVDDAAHKVQLEGIAGTIGVEELSPLRTAPAQRLTWTHGRYDVAEFGAGHVVLALDGDQLRIAELRLAAFGGELALSAMQVSLTRPEAEMTATISGIDAALVLPLFPQFATAARGRLDGSLSLRRDAEGIHVGAGRLALPAGAVADVLLKPSAGLLTSSLPESVRKHYPGLADLEAGRVPLRAEVLEIVIDPAGDAEGRTARVRLAGGPVDPRMRAPIDLTVNVRGPLESLFKFASDSRLNWGGGGNKR